MSGHPRITVRPGQMGGAPCIRGLRITVASVLRALADGVSAPDIVIDLPDLEPEDICAALRYAADQCSGPGLS